MVEEERSTGAPDPDPAEVGVENLSVEKIESPGPALFGDLLWNALFLPDSTKCLKKNCKKKCKQTALLNEYKACK